jgi:hypothetical protein
VPAGPGFDAGVDVENPAPPAVLDGLEAVDVVRGVDQEVPGTQVLIVLGDVGLLLDRLDDELDAKAAGNLAAESVGSNDGDLLGLDVDMAQDQGSEPCPTDPKPTISILPSKTAYFL